MDAGILGPVFGLAIFVFALVVFFKVIKVVFKVVFFLLIVGTVVCAFFGYYVYKDAMEFQERFATEPKLFVYQHDGKLITAFRISAIEIGEIEQINATELILYRKAFAQGNLEELLEGHYKILIFSKEAFASVETVSFGELSFTKEDIFQVMESEDSRDALIKLIAAKQGLPENVVEGTLAYENEEIKMLGFGMLIGKVFMQEGPLYLLKQYREGNVAIYPETIMFKLIKRFPERIFNLIMSKLQPEIWRKKHGVF